MAAKKKKAVTQAPKEARDQAKAAGQELVSDGGAAADAKAALAKAESEAKAAAEAVKAQVRDAHAAKADVLAAEREQNLGLVEYLEETLAKVGAEWPKEERERAFRVAKDLGELYIDQAKGVPDTEREIAHAVAAAKNIAVGASITAADAIVDALTQWLLKVSKSFLGFEAIPVARADPE